jgi:hypothetical protein
VVRRRDARTGDRGDKGDWLEVRLMHRGRSAVRQWNQVCIVEAGPPDLVALMIMAESAAAARPCLSRCCLYCPLATLLRWDDIYRLMASWDLLYSLVGDFPGGKVFGNNREQNMHKLYSIKAAASKRSLLNNDRDGSDPS